MSSVVNFLSSVCSIHMLPLPHEGGGAAKYVCLQFLRKFKLTCEKILESTPWCGRAFGFHLATYWTGLKS